MAITNYYVRATNGVDAAGQGTTHMTAYQTPQFALDDIGATHGRNAVDGDKINICDGALEGPNILAAPLSLATYGVPTDPAPLVFRGYTAVANDGGFGDNNGNNGAFPIFLSAYNYTHVIDMICRNVGDADLVSLGFQSIVENCIVHTAAKVDGYGISVSHGGFVARNHVYNTRGRAINMIGAGCVVGNYIQDGATYDIQAILVSNQVGTMMMNNIIHLQRAGSEGIFLYRSWGDVISGNIIYQSAAGTNSGILTSGAEAYSASIFNNIICGFSGVGGKGIWVDDKRLSAVGYNAFYNNTTNEQYDADPILDLGNDVALAADPFVNAAGGDFSLTAVAQALLRSEGWPESYLGASTDPHITIGVVQYGDAPVPCDYPLPEDVENGIVYGSGAYTGTLVCPSGGGARPGCRWPDYKRRFDI